MYNQILFLLVFPVILITDVGIQNNPILLAMMKNMNEGAKKVMYYEYTMKFDYSKTRCFIRFELNYLHEKRDITKNIGNYKE